ncbi:hypothetical protein VT99_10266 [Candidatus Electrothrix marina]|uniref:Uncharacterized protein n=1 Tax=Candidatus Electrothrix marina TaxID=1859130 RepID=A0A3S4TF20_9BACT|nr:hypothetical protein VT99_10266 [Candidatus Electrothrix marina]
MKSIMAIDDSLVPGNKGVDPVSVAVIISSIIGAATAAACTGASIAANELGKTKPEIVGAFVNRTKWTWKPKTGCNNTVHGHWGDAPVTVQTLWPAIKETAIQKGETYEQVAKEFNGDKESEEMITKLFYLCGDGMGGESLAVFEVADKEKNNDKDSEDDKADKMDHPGDGFMIAFYLKKKPGGHHYGGVAIGSSFNGKEKSHDGKGLDLIHEIQSHEEDEGNFATMSWETTQDSKEEYVIEHKTEKGTITVSFTPGENVIFDVTYDSPTKRTEPEEKPKDNGKTELKRFDKLSSVCMDYFKAFQAIIEETGKQYSFVSVPKTSKESDYYFSLIVFGDEILFKLSPLYSSPYDSSNIGKIIVGTSDEVFFEVSFSEQGLFSDKNEKVFTKDDYNNSILHLTDRSESKVIAEHVLLNISKEIAGTGP